jgi:signal transduction histidine kinase
LEEAVLRRHREIFYGLLFGFGAALIDTFIDSRTQGTSFWDVSVAMTLYRFCFVIFGFVLGWLLWRKNESERGVRLLQDRLQMLQKEISGPVTVIHAQAQVLLAGPRVQLSPEVQSLIRIIYEQSQKLQSINRENTPRAS